MSDFFVTAVGPWWPVWAALVVILGAGRWSRVLTYDKFPPAAWLRQKWADWTVRHNHDGWTDLLFCPWCATPWIVLIAIGTFFLTFTAVWVAWVWWIFWGWGALAYVASIVIAYDQPADS